MPVTKVFLGEMELREFEKPDFIQHGGGQHLAVNEFPGGNVSVQNFGSTYREISWTGLIIGEDAYNRMIQIGNMRQKGDPIILKTDKYSSEVIIKEFHADHKTDFRIPFSITLQRILKPKGSENNQDFADKASENIEQSQENSQTKTETYTVKPGDTLSKIARQYYGNANEYDKIYNDNKDILKKGPHLIYPGQELVINL